MNRADLERAVSRNLQQLPLPRAPRTLLPRVMAAVHAFASRPWYAREWLTWPLGWQVASATTLAVVVIAVLLLIPTARATAQVAATNVAPGTVATVIDATEFVGDTAGKASTTTSAVWIVWRVVLAPFVGYAAVVVALMCLACAAFATALNHLAFGKAFSR
jgi:hypothetical protein